MLTTALLKSKTFRYFLICLLLVAIFLSLLPLNVLSANNEKLQITEFDAYYSAGQVKASAKVKNISGEAIRFVPTLMVSQAGAVTKTGDTVEIGPDNVFWIDDSQDFVVLNKDEEKRVNFDFFLSSHLIDGTYNLTLQVQSEFRETYGSTRLQREFVGGDGTFLQFVQDSCKVVKNVNGKEEAFKAYIAPPFEKKERPKAVCTVKNLSQNPVVARIAFYTNEYQTFGFTLAKPTTSYGENVSFTPGETKEVSFLLPQKEAPQVYSAGVYFVDPNKTTDRLSSVNALRFTVKGESARVEGFKVKSVKDGLLGKKVNLTVDVFGAPDVYWDGASFSEKEKFAGSKLNGTLKAELLSKKGTVCAKAETPLKNVFKDKVSKDLSLNTISCEDPTLTLSVVDKDGKVLSQVNGLLVAGLSTVTLPSFVIIVTLVLLGILVVGGLLVVKKGVKK